jgi:hypothetical protein
MEDYKPIVLRMITGEDVISDTIHLNEAGNSRYLISNPLKIVYLPIKKGSHLSISLMQWMFSRISDNQDFEIKEHNVLMTTEPSDSLLEYYYKTVEYFLELRAEQKKLAEYDEAELYKEVAMSEDDDDEMIEKLEEVEKYLNDLSKKDKGTLH